MRPVAILGIGQTVVDEQWEKSIRDIAAEAVVNAMHDAGREIGKGRFRRQHDVGHYQQPVSPRPAGGGLGRPARRRCRQSGGGLRIGRGRVPLRVDGSRLRGTGFGHRGRRRKDDRPPSARSNGRPRHRRGCRLRSGHGCFVRWPERAGHAALHVRIWLEARRFRFVRHQRPRQCRA